jgi:putative salt-induced outer membrane protein YdiY
MKRLILHIAALVAVIVLVLGTSVSAQKRTDVLVMKNGDRITCEIISLGSGVLSVKLDYVDGAISINWREVAKVESDRFFIVKTENGSVYEGTIATATASGDEPVSIRVAEPGAPEPEIIEAEKVVTIAKSSQEFWSRFNGEVSMGLTYSKANNNAQYNISSSVAYPRERWGISAQFNSTLTSNKDSDTSTRNQLDINADRLLTRKNYFANGFVGLLQSTEQGIALQTIIGGGVGRYFINTNRARIKVVGGAAWQRTRYSGTTELQGTQDNATAVIATDINVFEFKKLKLKASAIFLPSVSEPGRINFRTNEDLYVKIYGNLDWKISFYGSWDNRPPIGLPSSDYGTSTGLSYSFGNN